jgi:hypothetical protein
VEHHPRPPDLGFADDDRLASVSLTQWVRQQLGQHFPEREQMAEAIRNGSPADVRRLLENTPFSDAQRRYLNELLRRWQSEIASASS